jgi:hypothetical protein
MTKSLIYCFALTGIIAASGLASTADDFGLPSYPGAKSDAETQEVCAEPEMGIIKEREEKSGLAKSKHCYRTNDSLANVVDFYKKQKGLKGGVVVDNPGARSATFCRGECNEVSVGTSVSISAPWFVPRTMNVNEDLLIVITNRT